MKLNRCLKAIGASLLVAVIMLTACAQPAKTPTPTPPAAGQPKSGGILKVGLNQAVTSVDTFVSYLATTVSLSKTYGQTLVCWQGKADTGATLVPLVAKSWDISPDGLTWTFHLKEGVKFQNIPPVNGREITADDFAYHLNRVNDPASKHMVRPVLDIKEVKVIDKYTFSVTTNLQNPGFIVYQAQGLAAPIPKEVVEAPGGAEKNWAGTGAFIMTDVAKDTKITFKKSANYWEQGKPYLDGVEFYVLADPSAQLAAFRAGQVDVLLAQGKTNMEAIKKSVPNAQIQDGVGTMEYALQFNNSRSPFDKKEVRQAIQYAIDYDGVINAALDGAGIRTGYLAPWFTEWGAKAAADLPKRDVAKAKALLAKAGYPDGFKTTIMQNTGAMGAIGNAVEPIVAQLKDIGIQCTIVTQDNASHTAKWRAKDYDMCINFCFTGRPYDVNNSIQQMWMTKSGYNFFNYSNPKVDELITAQQKAFPDKAKRIPFVKETLTILEDDVPVVPLYITMSYVVKQPWVKGWDNMSDPQTGYPMHALPYVWLDK